MMRKTLLRFSKYVLVGFSTFAFDLALLYLFTDVLAIDYLVSTGIAYVLAVSVNYFVSRRFVFSKTERELGRGYLMFVGLAGLGLLAVVGLMAICVELLGMDYVFARILVATLVGMCNYLINLFLTFKVAGAH